MFNSKEIARSALLRAGEIKSETRKKKRQWVFTTCISLCAVSAAILIAILPLNKLSDDFIFLGENEMPLAAILLPDSNTVPYAADSAGDHPVFSIPGYDTITVPANTVDLNMILLNPEGNSCWLTFEIILNETGKSLYISGLVAPSMCIENFALSQPLAEGEHKATLVIRVYEPESLDPKGGTEADFLIIAE